MVVKPPYFEDEKTGEKNKNGYKDIFYSNYVFIIKNLEEKI